MTRVVRRPSPVSPRLVCDTGLLIALERGDNRAKAVLVTAGRRGYVVVVPILVVMEAQAQSENLTRLNQVLKDIQQILPLSPDIGRQVKGLRALADVGSDADVVVVLEALAVPGSRIATGDPEDILKVISAANADGRVPLLRV